MSRASGQSWRRTRRGLSIFKPSTVLDTNSFKPNPSESFAQKVRRRRGKNELQKLCSNIASRQRRRDDFRAPFVLSLPPEEVILRVKLLPGLLLTLALSLALLAQSAQELYQRGLVQEQSKGNLQEAIKLYTQAAKSVGKDRGLAARALIRSAGSREKLGQLAEAADVYAEVLRTYPEQRAEATLAQDRLDLLRRSSSAVSSKSHNAGMTDVSMVTGLLFENYCSTCHNSTTTSGGLDLGALN